MATNTYKNKKPSTSSRSFFSYFDNWVNMDKIFNEGLPVELLMPILFVTLLCIFYIGNLHYAEKNIRKISKLRIEVEDLRADYTTLKADYMYASKQSEVVKKTKVLGLIEPENPPFKIVLTENER